jgi:hypothetical protein
MSLPAIPKPRGPIDGSQSRLGPFTSWAPLWPDVVWATRRLEALKTQVGLVPGSIRFNRDWATFNLGRDREEIANKVARTPWKRRTTEEPR